MWQARVLAPPLGSVWLLLPLGWIWLVAGDWLITTVCHLKGVGWMALPPRWASGLPLPRGVAPAAWLSLQVILDLSQREGIAVRRVLNTEGDVVSKFGVTDFPSCYVLFRNGSASRVPV